MVFVGLPILTYSYGTAVVGSVAVLIGIMVVVYNFLAVILLTLPHQNATGEDPAPWRRTATQVVRNPLILGCVGGLALAVIGTPVPVAVDRALELVGRIASPVALLAVGADLDFRHLRGDVTATVLVAVAKLAVYPGIVALVLLGCGLEGTAVAAVLRSSLSDGPEERRILLVPQFAGFCVSAPDDLRIELPVEIGQQDAQHVRPVRAQASGRAVGRELQFSRGIQDPAARVVADAGAPVEHP